LSNTPPPPPYGRSPSPASRGRISATPRLYLFTPPLGEPAAFADQLAAALESNDIAAVLLRLEDVDERTLINRAKAIAAVVQPRGVALLLDGQPDIAARAGADGAHLSGIDALTATIGALKPARIAGAGGLTSRHDAMLAGEANADYVMFGEPDRHGRTPPFAAVIERIEWWAEVFEIPCVGYAQNLDDVSALSQAGGDFVALGDWLWTSEQPPAAVVAKAAHALASSAKSLGEVVGSKER
jgi:thiamine-phosphate pyrophosphorylase